MQCEQAQELLVAYARGELPESQAADLEEHLDTCPSCRWSADAARRTVAILQQSAEPDIVELVNEILGTAIDRRASDIHVEPGRDEVVVRLRIDGVLHELRKLPKSSHRALTARIQTMGFADPFEARTPQFARIQVARQDREYDMRVTLLPAYWGHRITMRILDKGSVDLTGLDSIGLFEENLAALRDLLHRPTGLVVFAGPAGAGLTTTMYACLAEVNSPRISVLTVEDPVEYVLEGTTQVSLDTKAGVDYPTALRAILASDPDVVMVGQLRDAPTTSAAVNLAITGHLVLGSFHSAASPSALMRLGEMDLERHMLAPSLLGIVSQRLVRKVCSSCAKAYKPPADEVAFLHHAGLTGIPDKLSKGTGCEQCRNTGYRGRTAIHEILMMTHELADALAQGRYTEELGAQAIARNMVHDGAVKALEGITTVAEVRRVTMPIGGM